MQLNAPQLHQTTKTTDPPNFIARSEPNVEQIRQVRICCYFQTLYACVTKLKFVRYKIIT